MRPFQIRTIKLLLTRQMLGVWRRNNYLSTMDYKNSIKDYKDSMSIKYCPQCGTPISIGDKFCGKCGTRINSSELVPTFSAKGKEENEKLKGLIMTDTVALAKKLNVSREVIIKTINNYINDVAFYIDYQLFDVHESLQQEASMPLFSSAKRKDWKAYHKILYSSRHLVFHDKTDYLFIIGGEDIIPMPEIPNAFETKDPTIPTDYLYSYDTVISKDTIEILNSTSRQIIHFHIGRLPLGTDANFEIFEKYLNRAKKMMGKGIPIQMTYAQCDPHWKRVSKRTIAQLDKHGLIPDVQVDSQLCHENIFLTPYITIETVKNVFNPYANLFYFNLHGSSDPSNPCFLGQGATSDDTEYYKAISPKSFEDTQFDNIIVTEACYGGKFQGLTTSGSMLLTAIANRTLIYLGSSVIAMGNVDPQDKAVTPSISCADVLAKEFIRFLVEGKTAGEAFTHTRHRLYNSRNKAELLTLLEFSLYGDPALSAKFPAEVKADSTVSETPLQLSDKGSYDRITCEIVYTDNSDSILSYVRQRVDRRFEEVNSEIQYYLSGYGVKPRRLTTIRRITYGMDTQYWYTYDTDIYGTVMVVVDSDKTKTALFTKQKSISDRIRAGQNISINYLEIFRRMSRRFGLIRPNDHKSEDKVYIYSLTVWRDKFGIEDLALDSRIDEKSKLQVATFNTMLDETYRKRMANYNTPGLTIKDGSLPPIDFAALMNPLCLIIENELRLSVYEYLKYIKKEPRRNGRILDPTIGVMANAIHKHPNVMSKVGIHESFGDKLMNFTEGRNDSAHLGNINEDRFLELYTQFASIISDDTFCVLMELKETYNKNKNNYE